MGGETDAIRRRLAEFMGEPEHCDAMTHHGNAYGICTRPASSMRDGFHVCQHAPLRSYGSWARRGPSGTG